ACSRGPSSQARGPVRPARASPSGRWGARDAEVLPGGREPSPPRGAPGSTTSASTSIRRTAWRLDGHARLYRRVPAPARSLCRARDRGRRRARRSTRSFGLIDEGHDDIVFFADEGGSWQVGIYWRKVFPPWFRCLSNSERGGFRERGGRNRRRFRRTL